MTMEENRQKLKQSIEGLEQLKAPDIWSSIESELDASPEQNSASLKDAIKSLKDHEAPDVWIEVSSSLEEKKNFTWRYLSVAASISLLAVLAYLILPNPNRSNESIIYSTEELEVFQVEQDITPINSSADDMLLAYIKENCTRLAATCQDPEFKELLEIYTELNKTKEELNRALMVTTNRTQLMKYLIKVEKNQTEIGKDMLKKIKSI